MYYYLVPFVNHRQLKRAAGIDPRRDLHFYNRWQSHQARRSPGWPHHSSHGSRHHNRARCQLPDILSLLFPKIPQFLGNFREIFGKLPIPLYHVTLSLNVLMVQIFILAEPPYGPLYGVTYRSFLGFVKASGYEKSLVTTAFL